MLTSILLKPLLLLPALFFTNGSNAAAVPLEVPTDPQHKALTSRAVLENIGVSGYLFTCSGHDACMRIKFCKHESWNTCFEGVVIGEGTCVDLSSEWNDAITGLEPYDNYCIFYHDSGCPPAGHHRGFNKSRINNLGSVENAFHNDKFSSLKCWRNKP